MLLRPMTDISGFLSASTRIFRDRRIILGSGVSLLLSCIMGTVMYSQAAKLAMPQDILPVVAVLGVTIWPVAWVTRVSGSLVHEEYTHGTLELLLSLPISPRRLVLAMAMTPMMLSTVLCLCVLPSITIPLFAIQSNHGELLTEAALIYAGIFPLSGLIQWLEVRSKSRLAGKPVKKAQVPWLVFLFGLYGFASISTIAYLKSVSIIGFSTSAYIFLPLLITAFVTWNPEVHWSGKRKDESFSIEDMDRRSSESDKRTAGLMAILRKNEGTIFKRENESVYMTVEMIRQQALGGPLNSYEQKHEFVILVTVISTPFFLLVAPFNPAGLATVFRYAYALFLAESLLSIIAIAMREILNERASLRLDSIRVTPLPIQEVFEAKKRTATCNQTLVLKFLFFTGIGLTLLFNPFSFHRILIAACFYAAITAVVFKIAFQTGLRFGLSAHNDLEGSLWTLLFFVTWIVGPLIVGWGAPYAFSIQESMRPAVEWIASLSPFGFIVSIDALKPTLSQVAVASAVLAAGFVLGKILEKWNERCVLSAWK